MQLSKRKINKELEKQAHNFLYQTVADIKDPQEVKTLFHDLLSKTELSAVVKRLATAYLLKKGKNYREIKNSLKISSATISTIAEQLEKSQGFKIALEKIQADQWAEKWAKKIKRIFALNLSHDQ